MPDSFTVGVTTVTFTVLLGGEARRASAEVSIEHIPGGDVTVIDTGGALPWEATLQVLLSSSSDYMNLESLRGQKGFLTFIDGTAEAVLLRVQRTRLWPSGETEATAEFVVAT